MSNDKTQGDPDPDLEKQPPEEEAALEDDDAEDHEESMEDEEEESEESSPEDTAEEEKQSPPQNVADKDTPEEKSTSSEEEHEREEEKKEEAKEEKEGEEFEKENATKKQEGKEAAIAGKDFHGERQNVSIAEERLLTRRRVAIYAAAASLIIAAVVSIWQFKRISRRIEDQKFLRDIMVIQEALTQYAEQTHGDKNVDVERNGGNVQQVLEQNNSGNKWHIEQSNQSNGRIVTEVVIESPNRSLSEMETLDSRIDDGDLSTGNFKLKGKDTYSLRLMEMKNEDGQWKSSADNENMENGSSEAVGPANGKDLDRNYLKKEPKLRRGPE
jgi:hypothetical protein